MLLSYGFALVAVFASAVVKLIFRFSIKSGAGERATLVFYNLLAGFALILVLSPLPFSQVDSSAWWFFIGNGILWVVAGLLELKSYRYLSATDADIYGSLRLVFLTAAGLILFGESLSPIAFIGILLMFLTIFFNVPVGAVRLNRGVLYKLISVLLITFALIVDKYLCSWVPSQVVAVMAFIVPAMIYLLISLPKLSELSLELRSFGFMMILAPLLGAVRYYCFIQAITIGDLVTTTVILQTCVVVVFLMELLFLKERQGMVRRGFCSLGCVFSAMLVCLF